jgi:hypothetical protein
VGKGAKKDEAPDRSTETLCLIRGSKRHSRPCRERIFSPRICPRRAKTGWAGLAGAAGFASEGWVIITYRLEQKGIEKEQKNNRESYLIFMS